MKKTIKLLCTWAASLLLAGCSSEADMSKLMDWQSNPDAVHFTASVNNATTRTNPAATDDAQTKFKENDQVTVSNNGNQADYAYKENSWAPAIADKYLLWDRSNLTFNCWYPADGNNTATVGYLTADQSKAEDMAKSDYMNAETKLQTANDPLNFSLVRKTARIILKISGFTEQFESTATIKHVRIVSKASTAADETNTIDITPLTSGKGGIGSTYTALVAPGKVVAKLYFTNDMSDAKPVTMTTNVTAAGNSYIYNLIVGKKKIEVTGITAGTWTAASGTTTGDLTPIPYVTFTAEGEQTFKMSTSYIDPEFMPGIEPYKISGLQYSLNNGDWIDIEETGVSVTFGGNNGTLRLRGKNPKGTADDSNKYSYISFGNNKVPVTCTGDIRTLLDHESYKTVATHQARFIKLFQNCKAMTTAPDLPAETLADYCYSFMFDGCTSLKTAPKLPATKLAFFCYYSMFSRCKALETAPTLSAETLARNCYGYMFDGCTNLKTAPELRATQLFSGCYEGMFRGCSLESAPELSATTLAIQCYAYMFQDCKNLSSVTILASSDQIKNNYNCCNYWLKDAGTSAKSRKLIVLDKAAYNALETNSNHLSPIWKKDAEGTTVQYYTPKP